MRSLRFGGALLAALLLHLAGVHLFPSFFLACDLFLVLVVFNAEDGDTLAGLLGGLVAGLATDAVTGGLYGLHGLANTIIGYGIAFTVQRLVIQRESGALLLFAAAAAAQQALVMTLQVLLVPGAELPGIVWVLVKVATTGLLGMALFAANTRLRGRMDSWRRHRVSKLKFDR